MKNSIIETNYPLSFREETSTILGSHIKNCHSVELIGMKRVGISNFLRFFLYHKDIQKKYINDSKKHIFVPIDLNDLVEREIFPFWMLTLKRIADVVEKTNLAVSLKKEIARLFLDSIQSKDLFLLIDCIRSSLLIIIENGYLPTLFFIRFDRMQDKATSEFFANFEGLRDATHQKLSFVLTTYRNLTSLSHEIFNHAPLSIFSQDIYLKPSSSSDLQIVFQERIRHYKLKLSPEQKNTLFEFVGGHIQYLQLALIVLSENNKLHLKNKNRLFHLLISDERINLQSEELWESLTGEEQTLLTRLVRNNTLEDSKNIQDSYLIQTGFLVKKGQKFIVFSPLFEYFIKQNSAKDDKYNMDFSKKENELFTFLNENLNKICERESIIGAVWPEEEELGVSDWAIDRLVARVRHKLKKQKNNLEIITIKTRGYKLIS